MGNFLKLAAASAIVLAGPATALAKVPAKAPAKGAMKAPAGSMARIGGHPNLNGVWQVLSTANWNLEAHDAVTASTPGAERELGAIAATPAGLGVVEGGVIPYKPEALKKRDEYRAMGPNGDPEAACYLPGIPRATYINMPFQIIQAHDGDMLMAYEYDAANRVIQMKPVEIPPIDTWMGTSFGAWEGDTLKVITLALNPGEVMNNGRAGTTPGQTWLDRSGNYITNAATITERFKPIDKDHIMYEATIDDPTIFTRPWKISMPIYRRIEKNAQLMDFHCVPFADMLVYGDLYADRNKYPRK
jgi:hypothetical protein